MEINKDQKMIYLATAYSYKSRFPLLNRFVMWYRYNKVSKVAAKLMKQGYVVFSPITHSHVIATKGDLDQLSHSFWLSQDWWYVSRCDELYVMRQGDIPYSTGVQREMKWAYELGIPIKIY